MVRCLITGITGMVGSHLADYLIDNTDWEVYGLLRWRSSLHNIERHLDGINREVGRVRFLYGDLSDDRSIRACVRTSRPDYVFHLAGQSFAHTSFDSAIDTLNTNVQGTVRLLEALRECATEAFIHVCSSSEVYGRAKKIPIAEDAPFHPASPYAISKVAADLVGRHYAEAYGMKVMVSRAFTHTGPRRSGVFFESNFAKQVAMIEARMIEPVIKHGNLESLRTICDVRDMVRAYYLLLTAKPQPGEVYNIGSDFTREVGDVLFDLAKLARDDHLFRIFFEPDAARFRPIDADLQVADASKFKAHTGWAPQIPYEKTLLDLLNYWREQVKRGTVTR